MSPLILMHALDGAVLAALAYVTVALGEYIIYALDERPGRLSFDVVRFSILLSAFVFLGAFWGGLIAWALSSW